MPNWFKVSTYRADVNWVPLSVVKVKPVPREPKGKTSSTARFNAARASSVRQRRLRSQPTISRVQQSITETRYAQPTLGPAQTLVMSDCQTGICRSESFYMLAYLRIDRCFCRL